MKQQKACSRAKVVKRIKEYDQSEPGALLSKYERARQNIFEDIRV